MDIVYVVFGSAGEYSDRTTWIVKVLADFGKAKELATAAMNRANELYDEYANEDKMRYYNIPKGANQYDPEMRTDYTGTEYWVEEASFDEEITNG